MHYTLVTLAWRRAETILYKLFYDYNNYYRYEYSIVDNLIFRRWLRAVPDYGYHNCLLRHVRVRSAEQQFERSQTKQKDSEANEVQGNRFCTAYTYI